MELLQPRHKKNEILFVATCRDLRSIPTYLRNKSDEKDTHSMLSLICEI